MEEPILHENTRISPLMLSFIVHSALVLLFIIEMNMTDSSLPARREAEVIMMPEEQGAPFSHTALAPEPISSQPQAEKEDKEEKEEENMLKNFPSFKQLPNTPDASAYDEINSNPPESSSLSADADDEISAETIDNTLDEKTDEPAPAPAQPLAADAPTLTPQQHPTSLFDDIADQQDLSKTKQIATKLQAQHQQKKLSLADIGKRYQEYLHEERASNAQGIAGVTILGDDNAMPTAEQIKLSRFLEKINNQITKSWSRASRPQLHMSEGKYEAIFYMAINKNGTLKKLKLLQSTGNATLDAHIESVYKDASDWFPAIPDSFKFESYGFNIIQSFYMR